MELQNANWAYPKVADVNEPDVYPTLPEQKRNQADTKDKSRSHPYDLKAIGETVSQSLGSKLTQRRPPYNNNYNRGQQGRRWPPLQPQDWPYRPLNRNQDPNQTTVTKAQSQVAPAPTAPPQAGNDKGLAQAPTVAQSNQ